MFAVKENRLLEMGKGVIGIPGKFPCIVSAQLILIVVCGKLYRFFTLLIYFSFHISFGIQMNL
jgi:hypothetical protein